MSRAVAGRYEEAVRAALPPRELASPGFGVLECAPGEHDAVAAALEAVEPGWERRALAELPESAPAARGVVCGLPADAGTVLPRVNQRRGWLSGRGVRVVLVLDAAERVRWGAGAPDIDSVLEFSGVLPLEAGVVDEAAARAALAAWNVTRWGRLDLRGLVRSEGEDVAWPITTVAQELDVVSYDDVPSPQRFPLRWLHAHGTAASRRAAPAVAVLGPPGGGKTFLLRTLALRGAGAQVLAPLSALGVPRSAAELVGALEAWLLGEGLAYGRCLRSALAEGTVTLLLDGLDEVGGRAERVAVARAVDELVVAFPRAPLWVTARVAGYGDARLRSCVPVVLQPLSDAQVRSFLAAWCGQYAVDRAGAAARAGGEADGQRLAAEILGLPQLRALARSPLMLTVLAVVHRAGVQLPNHRAELYLHASRVLVERWNLVRSLASGTDARAPLRLTDALRVLGPVALGMVRSGARAVSTATLARAVTHALADGRLRFAGSADDVVELFKGSLGLFVEVGPDRWAFLHLTLAEYFAALELVRTGALEALADDPVEAFYPEWREILLLAAGELGVNRGEDARVDRLVRTLVAGAQRRRGAPSAVVPSVLGGLLADDPNLSRELAALLVGVLVPTWWFERAYGPRGVRAVMREARQLIAGQLERGPHAERLRAALREHYGGADLRRLVRNIATGSPASATHLCEALRLAGVDPGRLVAEALAHPEARAKMSAAAWMTGAWYRDGDTVRVELSASAWLDARVRAAEALVLRVRLREPGTRQGRTVTLAWADATPLSTDAGLVLLLSPLPAPAAFTADQGSAHASVVPAPRRLTAAGRAG